MSERYQTELSSGRILHTLCDEDKVYGHFEVEKDGRARIWRETWHDWFSPTDDVFCGPVSAMRSMLRGEI